MTNQARQITCRKSFTFPLVMYIIIMGTYYTVFGQSPYKIYDLHRALPYFRDQVSEWTITSNFTTDYVSTDCGDQPLLGGVTPTSYISSFVRTYENLIPHNTVITTFEISFIDSWPAGKGFISGYGTGNQNSILFNGVTSWTENACGNPSQADLVSKAIVTIIRAHSTSSLTLQLSPSATTTPQFAIRNVQITLTNNTATTIKTSVLFSSLYYNCITLLDGATIPANGAYICQCPTGQYKLNSSSCASCHSSCSSCFGPSETQCITCNTGYTYDGISCIACRESCETCFGTAENQCYTCPDGHYLYPNSTCWSTCPASYRSQSSNTLSCKYVKCRADNTLNYNENIYYYYYPNEDTCKETCPIPWVVVERLYDQPDCVFPLTQQETQQVHSISAKASTSANVVTGGLVAAAVVSPASPDGISSGTLAKQFEYTRYFDVTRSPRLEVFYEEQRSSPGVVTIGPPLSDGTITKFTYHSLPDIFVKANLHSSFLVNFFTTLESLFIIMGGVIFIFCLELIIIKHLKKFAIHFKKLRVAVLAFFVMQFYNVYTDILFYGTLEFTTFQGGNDLDWVSFFLAVIFYTIAVAVLILHFRLIRGYQACRINTKGQERAQRLEEFQEKHDSFEMLYKEFIDLSFIQQSYLFLLTVRASLAGIFMGTLHAHPIAQSSLITVLGIVSIIYLRFTPPFKSALSAIQQLAYEIVLLLVTLSFLVMACLDANGRNSDESRERLGEIVINSIFASKFLSLITIIPKTIEIAIDAAKALKEINKSKGPIRIAPETPSKEKILVPMTLRKKMMEKLRQLRTPRQAKKKVHAFPAEESPLVISP